MQPAEVEQELSAIPDFATRHHRWLDLIRIATAQSQAIPTSDEDSEGAAYLWQYPTTLTDLEPQAQRQWQHDAQTRFNLHDNHQKEFDAATEVQKRKWACKNRIRKAWGIEAEDILRDHLAAGAGGLGRSTLEILATIAEESQLDQAQSILEDVVTERMGTEPHVGRSRKQKLTRQDVMETRTRLKERNSEPNNAEPGTDDLANVTGRRKRKRAASTVNPRVQSKDDTGPARRSTAPPADLPTPGASHDSDSSHGADDGDVTGKSPEIGRLRQGSLPDFSSNFGGDGDSLATDPNGLSTIDSNPTPKGQDSTLGRFLPSRDSLQSLPDDPPNTGFHGPDRTIRPSGGKSSTRPFAFERTPTPDISTMPLREADGTVRQLAQAQFTLFFQNLQAIQELQVSNITRADNEIARITALLHERDDEAADCHAKLEQASEALDAAEAEQHNADAECVKHEPLRALCRDNNFSDAIRLALAQTEEELERLDQRLEDAVQAAEEARAEVEACEETAQQCQQALETLRQELRAAEKVRDRCKSTSSVLQGSRDEILSLSLGPRFPHDVS